MAWHSHNFTYLPATSLTMMCLDRPQVTLLILALSLAFVGAKGICQDQFQYRQQLTRADGLPSDDVYVITQDDEGFMWFGTGAGLGRYDGARFDLFSHEIGDSTSLSDDWIRDIEPVDNQLWIGTAEGISVLDLSADTFRNYQLDISGRQLAWGDPDGAGASLIHRDRLGAIWIAGREERGVGWCLYDPVADTFSCRRVPVSSVGAEVLRPAQVNNVLSIHRDNAMDSILWIGTMAGLIRYNIVDDALRHYYYTREPKSFEISYNVFRRMYQLPDGRFLVGSWSGGLNVFDPETGLMTPARHDRGDLPDLFFESIREILPKSATEVWVTLFKSLVAYDFVNERVTMRRESDFGTRKIFGADFIDRDGRIWSRLYGAHLFDPALQQFVHSRYEQLNPDGEGFTYGIVDDSVRNRLTVISRDCDGLYHYYPELGKWQKTAFPPAIASVRRFEGGNGVFLDDDHMIISSVHEIFQYDAGRDRISLPDRPLPVRLKTFDNAHVDPLGRVWFGTQIDGVLGWHPRDNSVIALTTELFLDSIPGFGYVRHIDRHGNLWLSCKGRTFLHNVHTGVTIDVCLRQRGFCGVKEVDEDLQGRLWLTRARGHDVVVVSGSSPFLKIDTMITLGTQKSPMLDLHCARDGWIWAFFHDRIVRIDPDTRETVTYSTHYLQDLQDIVTTHLVRENIMAIGLANGIVLIDLRELQHNTEHPVPYLSRIDVREQPLSTRVVPRKLDRLELANKENFFSIEFSALAYTLSDKNTFEYRLAGFQDTWVAAGGRRFANYTNVPSGNYTFELRAFNSEGDLSPHMVTLPVIIRKHWTEIMGVRVAMFLLVVGLIYATYRYRVHQIRHEEKLKNEFKMQLADIEMTALRAQMNPHFIFNCLNSIESFIIRNDAEKASLYLNEFARLIRLILQNSGSRSIPLQDELEALELYMNMESLRFADQFEYQIHVAPEIDTAYVSIPPLILQPYVENAIWHGLVPKPGKGTIQIRISADNDLLRCVIEDDGVGRNHQNGQSSRKHKKKSMGMAITRNRIELLNAVYQTNTQIKIEDLVTPEGLAAGTRVSLNIPI